MGLLRKDIKDLEIAVSLRRLGNKKVMEWDFSNALPTVHGFVHREVDLVSWVKRAAHYKVMDWDFRSTSPDEGSDLAELAEPAGTTPGRKGDSQELIDRLRSFLQFITVNLIEEPDRAEIRVQTIAPTVVRFRLVVGQKDLKTMLGRQGATASAIRNLLKNNAAAEGMNALLEILSHEEEAAHGVRSVDVS